MFPPSSVEPTAGHLSETHAHGIESDVDEPYLLEQSCNVVAGARAHERLDDRFYRARRRIRRVDCGGWSPCGAAKSADDLVEHREWDARLRWLPAEEQDYVIICEGGDQKRRPLAGALSCIPAALVARIAFPVGVMLPSLAGAAG